MDDEDCGFMLTASAYREMISVIEKLRGKDGIVRITRYSYLYTCWFGRPKRKLRKFGHENSEYA